MKSPLLTKLLLAAMAASLSGCIVIPAWDVDGHDGHHDGGYHYKQHGEHHDNRGGGYD